VVLSFAFQKHIRRRLKAHAIMRTLLAFMLCQAVAAIMPPAVRAAASSPGTAEQSPLNGFWVVGDGNWIVQISPCLGGFCGQLVGLSKSSRPDALRIDVHNVDPGQRNRPLCGLILMGGFTPSADDPDTWEGGWVYNPQNGETYAGRMWLDGPDTLKVRGYILISWFGRDETFTRETGPINRCSPTDAVGTGGEPP